MTRSRRALWTLLVASIPGVVGAARVSLAQDVEGPQEEAPARRRVVYARTQFDQWIFGLPGGETEVRARLGSFLEARIRGADRTYDLTEAQEQKLRLAARGDVKRLFDAVEEMQKRFDRDRDDPIKIRDLFKEITPLRLALLSDPFGDGSLFSKALDKTLVGEQLAKHAEVLRGRRLERYRDWVDVLIANDRQGLGLSGEQRLRLAELLMEESQPPRKRDQPDYEDVMLRVAALPEAKLKPIFDETQWRRINQSVAKAREVRAAP